MTTWVIVSAGIVALCMSAFRILRHVQVQQSELDKFRYDLSLALQGADEAAWTWHLDTQEFSQIGFEMLTEGDFPARMNAIAFIQTFVHPEDAPNFQKNLDNLLHGKIERLEVNYRLRHRNRKWTWVATSGRITASDSQGNPLRISGVNRNIDNDRQYQSDARIALAVVESMSEAVAVIDMQCCFVSVNPAFSKITGYLQEEILGLNRDILNTPHHNSSFYEGIKQNILEHGYWLGELWQRRKDQGEFLSKVEITGVMDNMGQCTHYVAVINDITDGKRIEQELIHLANFDSLTGLSNRSMLMSRLDKAIANARNLQTRVALLFIDLDNFKFINDTLGHNIGDRLLVIVAQRLKTITQDTKIVARLSGDEFVVLIETFENDQEIQDFAHSILAQFNEPICLSENRISILAASIGVSIFPDHAQTSSQLLKYADTAMYQAKSLGRSTVQFFNESLNAKSRRHAQLLGALKLALSRGEFTLNYQPRMRLGSNQVVSTEALLRWNSKEMGIVTPDVFIPLAEESGQIIEIGEWVIEEALRTLGRWHRSGMSHISMSINVSALQLQRSNLSEKISILVREFQIPEYCVELEITESMIIGQHAKSIANLWALKNLGVSLSLDDFGTGYSSLSYLKQLPIDTLKIDRSFIREIGSNINDDTLVKTIIALGHSLGMNMVAEGVEHEEHVDILKTFGCDEIQGYWLAKPMPDETCLQFLRDHEARNRDGDAISRLDSEVNA